MIRRIVLLKKEILEEICTQLWNSNDEKPFNVLYLILSSFFSSLCSIYYFCSFLSTFCYMKCNFHNNIYNVLSVTVLIYYGRSQLKLCFPGFRLLPFLNYLLYTLCWNNCYIYHAYIHCVSYCTVEKEINVNKYKYKCQSNEYLLQVQKIPYENINFQQV